MQHPKRTVFHSVVTRHGWTVKEGGELLAFHDTQAECEKDAVNRAKGVYNRRGLSKVILHKADGAVTDERTYGKDASKPSG